MQKMIKIAIIFMCLAVIGCAYELRLRYPSPVPSLPIYPINNVIVLIPNTEEEFQYWVEQEFGQKDPDCAGFVSEAQFGFFDDNLVTFTVIVLNRKDDGSINLDWLGHEIFYHYMEKERGHK